MKRGLRQNAEWDEGAVVPLSEQLNDLFAPAAPRDDDDELLRLEGGMVKPRGPMIERGEEEEEARFVGKKARLRLVPEIETRQDHKKTSRSELQQQLGGGSDDDEDEVEDEVELRMAEDDSDSGSDGSLQMDEDEFDDGGGDDDDEDDDLPMQQEERDSVMGALQESARQEMEKAKHVEAQNKLWQRLLAARIKMQGLMTAANQLPLPEDAAELRMHRGEQLRENLRGNLALLAQLRVRMMGNHPDLKSGAPNASPPLDAEESGDWWPWIAKSNAASVASEEAVVNAWNQRTNVQAGKSTFKAFGKPVMEQIKHSLQHDREKLIRRTQLNRSGVAPLGNKRRAEKQEPYYEENLFDDAEFYGQLLKTFLESSAAGTGGRVMARDSRTKKIRLQKTKLSLAIQEKLLNFMAPTASNVLPPMADALFGSLFGQIPGKQ